MRAALCADADTARGARRWNDANVVALSLRLTTAAVAAEVVDAFLATGVDPGEDRLIGASSRRRHGPDPGSAPTAVHAAHPPSSWLDLERSGPPEVSRLGGAPWCGTCRWST